MGLTHSQTLSIIKVEHNYHFMVNIYRYGQEKVNECFANIQRIMIQTLLSVQKVIIHDKHCFELYGFDILINSNLKPWVIEVNGR